MARPGQPRSRPPTIPPVSGGSANGGLAVLIMAAGEGTPDALIAAQGAAPVCGRPMVAWPVLAARDAGAERVAVIVSADPRSRPGLPKGHETVVQPEANGTGGAVRAAIESIRDADTVVVLSGDHPLISAEIISELLDPPIAATPRRR